MVNDGVEIERKFLLDTENLPWDRLKEARAMEFVQSYISFGPVMRVREVGGEVCYFTLKLPLDDEGLSQREVEFTISREEYESLLAKREGETIRKRRYELCEGGVCVTVDVYAGSLKGLAVAEVEFDSVEAARAFEPPAWFGKEVTADKRYKNFSLARDGLPSED